MSETVHNEKKDRWWQAFSASSVLWLTVCFFGPIVVELTQSPVNLGCVVVLFFVSSVIVAVSSFILVQLLPPRLFVPILVLMVAAGLMFYAQAFLLPYPYGELRREQIDWNNYWHYQLVSGLLWLLGLITAGLTRRFIVVHVTSIASMFLAYQFIFALTWYMLGPIVEQSDYFLTNVYKNSFSKSQNILLIVIDTLTPRDLQEVLAHHENLSKSLEGFTYYPDALGGYPTTFEAVSHILTGLFPDNSEPFNQFLRENLPTESIPGILKKAGFRTEAYGYGAPLARYAPAPVLDNITNQRKSPFPSPYEVAKLIFQFSIKCSPDFFKKYVIGFYYRKREHPESRDLARLAELEESAHVDAVRPVFKYEHFWGVHEPYCLSESMEIASPTNTLKARRGQARAYMKLFCRYIEALKKIGAFDNSMIFVIGDHGFMDQAQSPFPAMLWKPFNDSRPFRVSSKPVAHADIIKTICEVLGIPLHRRFGESLRTEDTTSSRIRRYFSHKGTDKHSWQYLPELSEFMITGRMDSFLSVMPTFLTYTFGRTEEAPRLRIGSTVQFRKNGNYLNYVGFRGWSFAKSDHVWNNGTEAELYLPIRATGEPIKLSIRCRPFVSAPHITRQRLRVVCGNGQVLFDGKLTEPTTIEFQISNDCFCGDVLALQFQFPDAVSPASVGISEEEEVLAIGFESLSIAA